MLGRLYEKSTRITLRTVSDCKIPVGSQTSPGQAINHRQKNLNVPFGSQAAFFVNITLTTGSGAKAAVPQI